MKVNVKLMIEANKPYWCITQKGEEFIQRFAADIPVNTTIELQEPEEQQQEPKKEQPEIKCLN